MSDLEKVINTTKEIETILRTNYSANGRGLHELASSIENQLDNQIVREIRFIATIRNKVVHEHNYNFEPDKNKFFDTGNRILSRLRNNNSYAPSFSASSRT